MSNFSYHNGQAQIEADADVLQARLEKLGESIYRELESDASSPEARHQIRTIFEIPTLEEGGLTDDELMSLFDGYLTLISHKQEKGDEQEVRTPEESPDE